MKNITATDYMNLHDIMLKARHNNSHNEELELLDQLTDMWHVMSDDEQDTAKEMIKELAYQQRG